MKLGLSRFKAKDPLLTPDSDRRLNRLMLFWIGSAIVFGYVVQEAGWDFHACGWCVWLSDRLPAIEVMSKGSYDPNAMRFVVLYHLIALPVFTSLLFIFVRRFRRYNLVWWGYPLGLAFILFGAYAAISGVDLGGADARTTWMRMYYEYLWFAAIGSGAPLVGLSIFFHHLFLLSVARISRFASNKYQAHSPGSDY